jgi:hypothetical protein
MRDFTSVLQELYATKSIAGSNRSGIAASASFFAMP